MDRTMAHYQVFETAAGFCAVAWNDAGITNLRLPVRDAAAAEHGLLRRAPGATPAVPPPAIAAAIAAVQRYFAGEAIDFSGVAVDLGPQAPFFEQVYAAARRLKWGDTTTYGAIAKALGAGPEMARDVGQAMASNPVPLIVPCHRVLAAGGKIGGFSAPGGAATKAKMLALEGVDLAPPAPAQQSLGF
jgi:methylated-DNA-[protein]-cysteine S-methyltransferase